MDVKDMNKGVQILLERMDSHPQEFWTDNPKWMGILNVIVKRARKLNDETPLALKATSEILRETFLTDEEVIVLHNKLQTVLAEEFTQTVMKRLLQDAPPVTVPPSEGQAIGGGGGSVTYGSILNNLGQNLYKNTP